MQKSKELFQMVIQHLQENSFNCIVQPKSSFPEIIAWRPFADITGNLFTINTMQNVKGKISNKVFIPFFVSFIVCKDSKDLSKKEKLAAKKTLEEGRCNTFFVAYKNKKKLEFQEIGLKMKGAKSKGEIKEIPSYLG